jgi:hypothetical protein
VILGAQTFTRERYPVDTEGEYDFDATPDSLVVRGCSIQPITGTETLQGREARRIAWTAWAPPGHDVRATDFARFNGQLYRVAGEPQRWEQGALAHDVILFERWEG